jgi:two-component system OmpR family response regulator
MNSKKLIFIVDDDPFINKLVVKRLSSDSIKVEAFESGEDCLDAIHKNPDLIILDYLFVKDDREIMNGMQILDKIKELKPNTPVIMLSGQDKGEIVLELARKGINDYIIKDSNLIDNLNAAVDEAFEKTE